MLIIFFINGTTSTEIYTLSLHDALPISRATDSFPNNEKKIAAGLLTTKCGKRGGRCGISESVRSGCPSSRSEEHTSELQSHVNLVCRLLLEKKKLSKITQLI